LTNLWTRAGLDAAGLASLLRRLCTWTSFRRCFPSSPRCPWRRQPRHRRRRTARTQGRRARSGPLQAAARGAQGAARRARASGTAGGAKAVKQLMRVLPHVELERKLQLLCDALELEREGRTHNHREGQRLSEELERLAQGISGTSNAFSEDCGKCSSYSNSGSGLSWLRRRVYGQASSKATTTRVPTEDHSESDEHPSVCGARAAHLRTTPQTA
jgi:hypothetical protein